MDNAALTPKEKRMLATTVLQAQEFAEVLSDIETMLFNTKQSLEEKLDSILSHRQKTVFVKLSKKYNLSLTEPEQVKALCKTVHNALSRMPTLTLTLAFDPNVSQIENIGDWLLVNCQTAYLLDIAVDPHIVGGAIVVANGRYRDYSLAKKLEESQSSKVKDQSLA